MLDHTLDTGRYDGTVVHLVTSVALSNPTALWWSIRTRRTPKRSRQPVRFGKQPGGLPVIDTKEGPVCFVYLELYVTALPLCLRHCSFLGILIERIRPGITYAASRPRVLRSLATKIRDANHHPAGGRRFHCPCLVVDLPQSYTATYTLGKVGDY